MDELLQQLPPGILFYAVSIPVLITALLVYAAVIRPALVRRNKRKAEQATLVVPTVSPVSPAETPAPAPEATVTPITPPRPVAVAPVPIGDDMPELDFLLTSMVSPSAPAPISVGPRQLGMAEVALITGQTVRAREELVLLRDPADGRLIVQMPGATYKSFEAVPAAKESFSRLMNELAKSLAQPDSPALSMFQPPAAAPSASVKAEAPAAPPVSPAPAPLPPQTPPVIPAIAPTDKDAPMPGDLPRYSNMRGAELKGRGFLGGPKFVFEDIPDLNLAKSIEDYLQHRLAQTPGYTGREWHVHPALDGGVRIEVDKVFFDSVGEISDITARTFIQTAIQEWQDRQ